jgi:hypothetical protein
MMLVSAELLAILAARRMACLLGFQCGIELMIESEIPGCGDLATLRNISATGPSPPLFSHSVR